MILTASHTDNGGENLNAAELVCGHYCRWRYWSCMWRIKEHPSCYSPCSFIVSDWQLTFTVGIHDFVMTKINSNCPLKGKCGRHSEVSSHKNVGNETETAATLRQKYRTTQRLLGTGINLRPEWSHHKFTITSWKKITFYWPCHILPEQI